VHDLICGHIIFIPLFVLAALQLPHQYQTWLLYQNALSSDVVVSDILRYAQKNKKSGSSSDNQDLVDQIAELKKIVQKQEEMLASVGFKTDDKTVKRNESTDAIAELVSPRNEDEVQISRPAMGGGMGGRAVSMSGLDVWGPMTIGDGNQPEQSDGGFMSYQNTPYNTSSGQQSETPQEFTFSQPDKMPPR